MKINNRILFLAVALLMSFSIKSNNDITIYLAGDSTMANKEVRAYPETGWGMVLHTFFDQSVRVDNRARNGRSTRTFIGENRWQSIADDLKPGDYIFIQFGHNDESKEKTDRYTTPEQYKINLTRFINETRARVANPILFTPVTRRRFDENGNVRETHLEYSALVREVAKECNVPLIDHDNLSRNLLHEYGVEKSKLLFLQLEPGEHPNYPEGVNDNTHFSEWGARKMAHLVVNEIKVQNLDLASRIVRKQ